MIKLESQVCSLESAKRLKELGVRQESLYRWQNVAGLWEPTALKKEYIEKYNINPEIYAALTSTELGEILPWEIENNKLVIHKFTSGWSIDYYNFEDNFFSFYNTFSEIEVEARARMLIAVIENKWMKIE